MKKVILVTSVEEAQKVTTEGSLPAVDCTYLEGQLLSTKLRRLGIRQATYKECLDAGMGRTL